MKKVLQVIFVILTFLFLPTSVYGGTVELPDLLSFSHGIGSVSQTGHERINGFEIYEYQCDTDYVEPLVQEYIKELRKFGIYIAKTEKEEYDRKTNDNNYGIALRDKDTGRKKIPVSDSVHDWFFNDVSVYIEFSTGGSYGSQYISIFYAEGSYITADTGARMQTDRKFSPADYYFYRDQLTEDQKKAYDYILPKVERMESPISLTGLKTHLQPDDFFLVWYSVLADNPQIFTLDDGYAGDYTYFGDGAVKSFSAHYWYDKKDLPAMKKSYEEAIQKALAVIDPYMTDYQKERALHDWLCDHVFYDREIKTASSGSYTPLVKGYAVCEGYAEAFTELLHRAGIEAATVNGFVQGSGHAWNIVCIDGNWYYVDVTFDDDLSSYEYFNLSTDQMALDHVNGIGTFPQCNRWEEDEH